MVEPTNGHCSLEDGDAVSLDICAIDVDCVGTLPHAGDAGDAAPGFSNERVLLAIKALQSEGLKVILVSSRDLAPFIDEHTADVDIANVLHVKATGRSAGETVLDLLRVADEYRCPFLANDNVGSLATDWRVPWQRQAWLRRVHRHLHIRFVFSSAGNFGAAIPEKVRLHLEHVKCQKAFCQRQEGVSASTSSSSSTEDSELRVLPPRTEIPVTAAWLGGLETLQPSAEPALPAPPPPPLHEGQRPPRDPLPPPPPPPPAETAVAWRQTLADAPAHLAGRAESSTPGQAPAVLPPFTFDEEWPNAAVLRPRHPTHQSETALFCLLCDEKSKGLFPYAMELGSKVIVSDQIQELDDEEDIRPEVSALVGAAQWSFVNFATATGVGSRDHGIRAIGVGSNSKARRRAARIALAVTVRLRSPTLSCESPDGTAAFAQLVQRARRLFAGQGRSVPGRMGSAASPSIGAPLPLPDGPGFEAGLETEEAELSSPRGEHRAPGPCLDSILRRRGLQGKTVVASAAYESEGGGYLPLMPGDHLCILCEEPFPADDNSKFLQYLYGRRYFGPSDRSGAPCDGWFPYALATFETTY